MPCRPAPTQLLSYYAGRTKRITLGTAVIVLPWHDPVRVAEEIALLDVLSGGRCLFGFGRGRRERRVRRLPHPDGGGAAALRRGGARSSSRRSRQRRLRLGRGVLQDPADLDPAAPDLPPRAALLRLVGEPRVGRDHGQARLRRAGHHAERVADGRRGHPALPGDRAQRRAHAPRRRSSSPTSRWRRAGPRPTSAPLTYLSRKFDSIDTHYHFSDGHLASVKGYEAYGKIGQDLRQDEGPELPPEGDRLLREDPGRRHARRLHPAARRAAAADRPRPPGHRVRLRRHAARGVRAQHASLRRSRHAGAPARCRLRRPRAGSGGGAGGSGPRAEGVFAPA